MVASSAEAAEASKGELLCTVYSELFHMEDINFRIVEQEHSSVYITIS